MVTKDCKEYRKDSYSKSNSNNTNNNRGNDNLAIPREWAISIPSLRTTSIDINTFQDVRFDPLDSCFIASTYIYFSFVNGSMDS